MDSKLANLFQYGHGPSINQCGSSIGIDRAYSIDEMAKMQAEKEAHENEYKRKAIACAIVGIAEALVTEHNVSVEAALETAKTLALAGQDFITNFKLPE